MLSKNIMIPLGIFFAATNLNTCDAKRRDVQENKNVSYLQYSTKNELHAFAHVIRTRGPILFSRVAWRQIVVFM